jgi:hypothetical protein
VITIGIAPTIEIAKRLAGVMVEGGVCIEVAVVVISGLYQQLRIELLNDCVFYSLYRFRVRVYIQVRNRLQALSPTSSHIRRLCGISKKAREAGHFADIESFWAKL